MEKVMCKIGQVARKTYRCAADATGKVAREIKLKAEMADNKSQIREIYEEIGKKVYEKYLLQEHLDIQLDFTEDCAMIDSLANKVEDLRMEILDLKDLKQCPKCYYEIDVEYHYCPNCGHEQTLSGEAKQNDGPATIETTDETDTVLRKNSGTKNMQETEGKTEVVEDIELEDLDEIDSDDE